MASEAERRAMRDRCERDLYFLNSKVLGFSFLTKDFHKEFSALAQDGIRPWRSTDPEDKQWRGLLAPRGHGKTTEWTVGGMIQAQLKAGIDKNGHWRSPHFSQGIAHALDDKSQEIANETRKQWESNDTLKWLASDLSYRNPERESPKWTSSAYTLRRPTHYRVPSVVSFSPKASTVGMHFDMIWFDDVVMDVNSQTAEDRAKVLTFIRNSLALMKPMGWKRMMVAGTHWDVDDAYAAMRDEGGDFAGNIKLSVYDVFKVDGQPLWPEAYSLAALEKLERQLGPYIFSCCYRNDPMPAGIASFEAEHVQRYDATFDREGHWIPPDETRGYTILMAVDPNTSEETAYDPAAVTVAAWDSAGCIWVIDLLHGHPSPSELIDWIRGCVEKYRPTRILYEDVQAQKQAFHWMERDSIVNGVRFPIQPVKRGPKAGKYMRIMALAPLIKSDGLFVPNGSKYSPIMDEIKKYSKRAKRDDCLDTLADIYNENLKPSVPTEQIIPPSDPWMLSRITGCRADRMNKGATESALGAVENIYR